MRITYNPAVTWSQVSDASRSALQQSHNVTHLSSARWHIRHLEHSSSYCADKSLIMCCINTDTPQSSPVVWVVLGETPAWELLPRQHRAPDLSLPSAARSASRPVPCLWTVTALPLVCRLPWLQRQTLYEHIISYTSYFISFYTFKLHTYLGMGCYLKAA